MPSSATPPSIFPVAGPGGSQRAPQGKAAESSSAAEAFAAALGNASSASTGKSTATSKTDTDAKARAEATDAEPAANPGTQGEGQDQRALFAALPTSAQGEPANAPIKVDAEAIAAAASNLNAEPGVDKSGQTQAAAAPTGANPETAVDEAVASQPKQAMDDGTKAATDRKADAAVTQPDPRPATGRPDQAQDERPTSGRVRADEVKADPLTARETRASEVLTRLMSEGQRTEGAKTASSEGKEGHLAGLAKAADAATGKATGNAATPKAAEAQAAARANTQTQVQSETQPAETGDIEAPQTGVERLKDAKPVSERTPGELLRSDIRQARSEAGRGVEASAAKASDAKSAHAGSSATEIKPDASAHAAARPATPSTIIPPAFQAMPAFEFMLAGLPQGGELMLDEVSLDPALSKSDAAFDPVAARGDARAEIRTASTLQFAQGPRLTPQSAQTMAAQIAQRFNEGSRVFDIRMDPPELGRVEVRLEVGKDNSVRAVLAAERTETLAELQRSARELERALTEAGLDVGEDALSFSLSDEGSSLFDDNRSETGPNTPVFVDGESGLDRLEGPLAPVSTYGFLLARAEGLDVSV